MKLIPLLRTRSVAISVSLCCFCVVLKLLIWQYNLHGYNDPLRVVLQDLSGVSIYYVDSSEEWSVYSQKKFWCPRYESGSGQWMGELPVVDHQRYKNKLLRLLSESRDIHSEPSFSQEGGGYVLLLACRNFHCMNLHPYAYISRTGELGRGHEWAYVPKEFKEWMDTLKPSMNLLKDDPVFTSKSGRISP